MNNVGIRTSQRVVRLVAAAAMLCLAAAGQNTAYLQDPGWRPPARAAARKNPLHGDPSAVAGGRKLFRRECAACHGGEGGGIANAADLQLPVVQEQSDGELFWKISNGNPRRGMPSFSSLPELQRWQLVLYIRTLRQQPPPGK